MVSINYPFQITTTTFAIEKLGPFEILSYKVYHDATSYFFLKIVLTQITQKITINRVYADPPH